MVSDKRLMDKGKLQKPEKPMNLVEREYTEAEKAEIARYTERLNRKPLKFKSVKGSLNKPTLEVHTTDAALTAAKFTDALGTPDTDLQAYLLNQVYQTFKGLVTSEGFDYDKLEDTANSAMALLSGIQPRDEIEGMLAVQMIAVHNLAMETVKRAMIIDQTFEGKEANVNQATKMLRTFTMQMEALKRYRTGGEQKVIVEHVNVNQGGQAIVGAVSTGGRGCGDQRHE